MLRSQLRPLNEKECPNKLPELTAIYWVLKITATTLGETAGDLLSMTLGIGYGISTLILMPFFLVSVIGQLAVKEHKPWLYWTVILTTSTAGTTMSDWIDRTLGFGYLQGSLILVLLFAAILAYWRFFTSYSMSVTHVTSFRVEVLYWIAIVSSNTLGTALGDYLADDSGLGFAVIAVILAGSLALILAANYFTNLSKVLLFWIAFVQTRPFGATLGDTLTKPLAQGGFGFGTVGTSAALAAITIIGVVYVTRSGSHASSSRGVLVLHE
ncbi:MAG TPA: hypothetical protein VFG30_38160 [Polyangiales bacterium]|nr:hypothetical protein [Polyangiales bacterium]